MSNLVPRVSGLGDPRLRRIRSGALVGVAAILGAQPRDPGNEVGT